ncbi:MAG: DUF4163 domain-containing protein [Clostridiaceae bacterium]|jgi:inhibitor of cysteine peptidase|nr:DUF4163 domain-containing protein [Clostridiaceae bacterium]
MFKKMLILVLAFVMCMAGAVDTYAADDKNLEVELNGKTFEMPGKVWEGELFLPLRAVSEELGYDVEWFGEKQEIKMSKSEENINLSLSDDKLNIKGHESYMTGGHRIVDDRTYLRQDFFSDNLGLKVTWDKTYNKVTLQGVEGNPIIINNRKEASETDTLKLTIQYPEIEGLNNTEVQNKLNSLFAKLASDAKAEGIKAEKDLIQVQIENHIKAEVYFNYQVKYNQKDMLSIVFSNYQYSGGAHGITVQSSYTFDLKTGKEYEIKDLFPEGSEYMSTINSAIKKQMEERNMTDTLVPFESIKADQDFYLSNSAVVVYFQQYEYYPYALGIPEFAVDYPLMEGYSIPLQ